MMFANLTLSGLRNYDNTASCSIYTKRMLHNIIYKKHTLFSLFVVVKVCEMKISALIKFCRPKFRDTR